MGTSLIKYKYMSIEVKRKENENISSVLYQFNKKIKRSGVLKEAKKRRFRTRPESKLKKKEAALHRIKKEKERRRMKKLGY